MRYLLFLFLLISFAARAAEPRYPVSSIPEEMKKGMYAVIREKEVRFSIESRGSSSYYIREVITILNSKAKSHAVVGTWYDKLSSIKFIRAVVYDAYGKEIKKLKNSDLNDESTFDGYTLFSDSRVKSADLGQTVYPYTVEHEYEVQYKHLYSAPDFFTYQDDEISTQNLVYSVIYPNGLKPRYKLFKVSEPLVEKTKDRREQMVWKFEKVIPQKFEKNSTDLDKTVPNISVSPKEFEFAGYGGQMDSWKEYGLWLASLNKGRDILPEAAKIIVRDLTLNAKTEEEKIKILYEYMQNRTRYVGIQLGIGGLQTFEAKTVDQTGYGDCKALSNYMVALLKEVNITGYYTTIMAGRNESAVDATFPSHQANHIIVAVPNKTDTIWLECTSQINPFGWMGNFTDDRYAMMVTEQGGVLVKTPSYPAEINTQSTKAEVTLDLTGNAKATVRTNYAGLQYENNRLHAVLTQASDDQKKWLQETTQIPIFDVKKFSMKNKKDKIPSAEVEMELVLNRYASVNGKRIFMTPNLMNRTTYIPEKLEKRNTNIVLRMPYIDTDTIQFNIPEAIYPEFLPEPIKIKSRFGEYESTYKIEEGKLIYTRRMRMNKGEFPADSYGEFTEFYRNVNKADNVKLVFLNKT